MKDGDPIMGYPKEQVDQINLTATRCSLPDGALRLRNCPKKGIEALARYPIEHEKSIHY